MQIKCHIQRYMRIIRQPKYYFLFITVRCQLRIDFCMTGLLLVKKLAAFDGNQTSIAAFTEARPMPRLCEMVRNMIGFTVKSCQYLAQQPNWRTTPCLLSATVHSIKSQLPPVSKLRKYRAVATGTHKSGGLNIHCLLFDRTKRLIKHEP